MNAKTKTKWLGAALLAVAGLAGSAQAAGVGSPSYLNIDVTITASKSVSVLGLNSSTDTSTSWNATPNLAVVAPTTTTVVNDSGVLSEGWKLSTNANSLDTTGGAQTWALSASSTSVGADAFALQAVFGSSNTALGGCSASSWNNGTISPLLTSGAGVAYTAAVFADSALNAAGGLFAPDSGVNMLANAANGQGKRAMCWRVILPASTATLNKQNIQVIVTAY